MIPEEDRIIVDKVLNNQGDRLETLSQQMQARKAEFLGVAKNFRQREDEKLAEGGVPNPATLADYTTRSNGIERAYAIVDDIIAQKPDSPLRFLAQLEEASRFETQAYNQMLTAYQKRITDAGEALPEDASDIARIVRSSVFSEAERAAIYEQNTVAERLTNTYLSQKRGFIADMESLHGTFSKKHYEIALDAVRSTVTNEPQQAPQPPSPYDPNLLKAAEEYRAIKNLTLERKGDGPRDTPAVETPSTPAKGR